MSSTIVIEGGLFDPDLLERLTTAPEEVEGQKPRDFGLEPRVRLADEIQEAFGRVLSHWRSFERRRLAAGEGAIGRIAREGWVLPLLRELGFEPRFRRQALGGGDGSFPISHGEGEEEAPLVPIHLAPFEQELDSRGEGRRSPHGLLQDCLDRTDLLWGIVSNGRRLRLLRASARTTRQAFLEVDLEAIARDELYPDFALLFRLLHRSRFPTSPGAAHECLLERWYQKAIEEGGRVREKLREGVEKALEILGTGFLAHPESEKLRAALRERRLSPEAFRDQLLVLVYRLLFLLTAEERRLLANPDEGSARRYPIYERWYGISRLRERAERRRPDPWADLWMGLTVLFRALDEPEEAPKLGLYALDGDLFAARTCADLEEARIANDRLLEALFHLSTFEPEEGRGRRTRRGPRRRVRFSALDVEELGSVYESLLELHPVVDPEVPRFAFVAGQERKSTGSYYTPDSLVRALVESALDPVLEARLAKAKTPAERERAILSLKVIDPAAGSGHFLLAAARRLAQELARVRTGESEPPPAARREALRDVVRSCLYAVDKNPRAVDLAKVALWIESLVPGVPLSFLDPHLRRGDSLLGMFALEPLARGIPDAAYAPLEGDDRAVARKLLERNRKERGEDRNDLFFHDVPDLLRTLAAGLERIAAMPEATLAQVQAKRGAFRAWQASPEHERLKLACDLWCAAFFLPKRAATEKLVPTSRHLAEALSGERARLPSPMLARVEEIAEEEGFFHWPLAFPDAFARGGFDVVLGNPPWERIKLQEQEFFATRDPEIANAPNAAARQRLIRGLAERNPALFAAFAEAKRRAEAASRFVRTKGEEGGRFPLTGTGDVNTYALFAELFDELVSPDGRAGLIVPTGIATDATTAPFFARLVRERRLVRLVDFENRKGLFPAVDSRTKFALVTLGRTATAPEFAFFLTEPRELSDAERRFTLSAEDIARINPNTKTAPIFRSRADAELTKKIYARVPVLIDESKGEAGNPWGVSFRQGLFNMTSDSHLFRTAAQLRAEGFERCGTVWQKGGERFLPLYEGKMIHQFDHRWATYQEDGRSTRDVMVGEKADPDFEPTPRYWVPESEVEARLAKKGWERGWLLGWRDITNATNERTVIASVVPRVGVADNTRLIFLSVGPTHIASASANLNSLVFDYCARLKIGGTHVTNFYLKQLPVVPPGCYSEEKLAFIVPRVLELTYTSHAMRPFAEDLGHDGPPFSWDEDRRACLRAELDAFFAWAYGLSRDELRYVLDPADVFGPDHPSETFRVLAENETRKYGEYRTRRLVLEAWDRLARDGVIDPANPPPIPGSG
ncbi:MAG: N-6 DNA methylase [Geminicoccaceae bacterium]|nr:N-6 DNA methylase [Geminicoccaceae bacterium]